MWHWKGKGFVIPAVVFFMVVFLFKNLLAGQDEYGRTPVADNIMGVSENNQENEGRQGLAATGREDAGSRRQAVRQRMAERRGGRCRSNENRKGMDENTGRDIPADQDSQPSDKNDTNRAAPFQSPDWMYEAVDEFKAWEYCYQRTIALDADNHPHLAYGGDHLYHGWYDGGNWWNETVDSSPNVGAHASLVIDTAGHAHISYLDSDNKCLKYATNASGKWIMAIVDGSGTVTGWTSLSLDAAGHAHISYVRENGVYYATNATGKWMTSVVDSSGINYTTSLALDAAGHAHISFAANRDMKYATNTSGSWIITTVDDDAATRGCAIALDTTGHAHIGYSGDNNLKYATNATGAWMATTVGDDSYSLVSMSLDAAGHAHFSYNGDGGYGFKYATNTSGSWVWSTVEKQNSGSATYSSLALDAAGHAHLGIFGYSYVEYATNASGSWVTDNVDGVVNISGVSLVVDAAGHEHCCYAGTGWYGYPHYLEYATNASGTWARTIVNADNDNVSISNISLAVDTAGHAHICCSTASGAIKHITNASGAWVTTVVDDGAYEISLAVDAAGHAHISYSSTGGGDCFTWYATNASGSWGKTKLGKGGSGCGRSGSSLELDAAGHAHIIYSGYDSNLENFLVYATNATGSWVMTTAVATGRSEMASYPSLAVDATGHAHISYLFTDQSYHLFIYYATNASGSWVTTDIGNSDIGLWSPSIAVDTAGHAHISYIAHTGTEVHLKYAANTSGAWVTTAVQGHNVAWSSLGLDAADNVYIGYYDMSSGYDLALRCATNKLPFVSAFKVKDGASETTSRTVALNNTATGSPTHYMASESAAFEDGTWQTYEVAPAFTLSAGDELKAVYFKVKDNNRESPAVCDVIILNEVPVVTAFQINNGAAVTLSRTVTLNNMATGSPTHYMASESAGFSGAVWQPYSASPSFTLSAGGGVKTVYFKTKDNNGASVVWNDAITLYVLPEVTSFQINNGASDTTNSTVTLNNTVTGFPTPSHYMASESSSFTGATWQTYAAAPAFTLSEGYGVKTIYFQVRSDAGESAVVNDTITLKELPVVSTFQINDGASETASRTVTLNNTATGSPSHYMASESSGFTGATWQTYAAAPTFTLSAGDGVKTVYFKVKNASGESAVVNDTITLKGTLVVSTFQINNGAIMAKKPSVKLNNTVAGSPTHYMASESATFTGAKWKAYKTSPRFVLSKNTGVKTVYFKVKNGSGESAAVNDTINLGK